MPRKSGRGSKLDKEIGNRMRIRRVQKNLSQHQIGDELGLSYQQIAKYERGLNSLRSGHIADLCRVLNITPNELFFGHQSQQIDISAVTPLTLTSLTAKITIEAARLPQSLAAILLTFLRALNSWRSEPKPKKRNQRS